ncbi:MAG: oligosaccharide flippase family protein [candidate division WOR-3 bacterium]|jgi:putative peptidoglycan lipid II flippase|nr:oligosaccharide flippase family protein [candidate division WOR-3 bacterium]MCR4423978.1 oligosaccharide flippase family protein [candidate division WOR-3 bacterium]MDH7519603.1 lipid II flippase MurJ [bacterium]
MAFTRSSPAENPLPRFAVRTLHMPFGVSHLTLTRALTVTLLTTLSKILGFVREMLLAHIFGTAPIVDAYRVGETITTVGGGFISNTFDVSALPLLVERKLCKDEVSSRNLFASLWTIGLLFALAIALITFIAAPFLVSIFAPKIGPQTRTLALTVTRLMAIVPAALILISATAAYHNSRRKFAIPRLIDPVINLVAILFIVIWAKKSGTFALAAGWSSGHLIGLVVTVAPLIFTGHRLLRSVRDPGVREFFLLSLPLLAFLFIRPVNLALGRLFSSFLPSGSIAILGYADRLFAFPCNLIAASIGTIFFTRASELAATGKSLHLRRQTGQLLKISTLILIPATVLLLFIARPLVRLLYEHGAFTPEAGAKTALALAILGLGLMPFTAAAILTAYFRGQKNTRTPVIAALLGAGTTALIDFVLVHPLGIPGLALGSTAGLTTNMGYLLCAFQRDKASAPRTDLR